jgi:hypothetical protein
MNDAEEESTKSFEFPVEAGQVMMFARSIGDPNPIYSDAEYARSTELGEIIAPPTFVQSSAQYDPEYALRPRIGEPWIGSGREPTGARLPSDEVSGGTRLHAEQHFVYHRPLGPGEVLTVTVRDGETWTRTSRRGETLVFSERITEYQDQVGRSVVLAMSVGVLITKNVEGNRDGS